MLQDQLHISKLVFLLLRGSGGLCAMSTLRVQAECAQIREGSFATPCALGETPCSVFVGLCSCSAERLEHLQYILLLFSCGHPPSSEFRTTYSVMPRLSQSERIRIVHLSAEGYSPTLISRKIGCSVKTVRFWVHRHKSSGSTRSIEGSGRPVLLSVDARKRAVQLLVAGVDGGARFVARKLFAEGLTPTLVLPGTVLRGAKAQSKEDGDDLICRRGRPPKLLSAVNKTRRVSFCTMNKSRPWARVMFTDRCKFAFRYPGCVVRSVRWLHRSKLHEDGAPRPNRPSVYNVYGGVTRYGTTKLHSVTGTTGQKGPFVNKKGHAAKNITQGEYEDVLTRTLLREGRRIFSGQGMSSWVLQQDGDKAHAKAPDVVQKYNSKHPGCCVSVLPDWPGNSPDLSPIENLWGYVDAEVARLGCKTFQEFKDAVDFTFQNVPRRVLENLFKSVPNRLRRCIDLEGCKTGY